MFSPQPATNERRSSRYTFFTFSAYGSERIQESTHLWIQENRVHNGHRSEYVVCIGITFDEDSVLLLNSQKLKIKMRGWGAYHLSLVIDGLDDVGNIFLKSRERHLLVFDGGPERIEVFGNECSLNTHKFVTEIIFGLLEGGDGVPSVRSEHPNIHGFYERLHHMKVHPREIYLGAFLWNYL